MERRRSELWQRRLLRQHLRRRDADRRPQLEAMAKRLREEEKFKSDELAARRAAEEAAAAKKD